MSAEATSWAWSVADKLDNQGQLCVLLALAEHAGPTGECFPKRKTIAEMCGFAGPAPVTRHINRMMELGLVEKEARYQERKDRGTVWRTSNEYRLCLEVEGRKLTGVVALKGGSSPEPRGGQDELPGVGPQQPPHEPSVEPTSNEPTVPSSDDEAKKVYDHWLKLFQPSRPPVFGAAVVRQIDKGLALYSADDLCLAFTGLFEWRKRKPGKTNLGAVLDTYPGGKPLHEQIAFFITQGEGATGVGGKFPSAARATIAEHQRWVLRGHRLKDNAEAVSKGKESEEWLFEHGLIAVVLDGEDRPTFRQRLDSETELVNRVVA